MNYQILDLETYKRKSHFEYFSQLAYPYVGVTADVDITKFHAKIKEQRLPFFLSFMENAEEPFDFEHYPHVADYILQLRERMAELFIQEGQKN